MSRTVCTVVVLALCGLPLRAHADVEVVDRVVAVVQVRSGVGRETPNRQTLPPDVITLSGLEFEARVALVQRGARRAATDPLDEETLRGALENGISERLLAGEAEALQAWRIEPAEVETAVRAFREQFEDEAAFTAFLRRHEVDLQALARLMERSLRATRVLDSKVRLRAQVTESEVRRYFDAHRSQIPGEWLEVRKALREKLVRERYGELVRAELEQLRRAHDVRRVAPLAWVERRGEAG